jgi:hypothetical protein
MIRPKVWHPILVAVYPILHTFTANLEEVNASELVLPLLLALTLAMVVWALLVRPCGGWAPAALVASPILLCLMTGGHALRAADRGDTGSTFLILLQSALLVAALAAFLGRKSAPKGLTTFLNRASILAICFPFSTLALHAIADFRDRHKLTEEDREMLASLDLADDWQRPPDVYYIVLDGFGRGDVLLRHYHLDNEPFLRQLEERGFFVARRSTTNYPKTVPSLACSLNLAYHDATGIGATRYAHLIRDSLVARFLRDRGYRHICFATGFSSTEVRTADEFLFLPDERNAFRSLVEANSLLTLLHGPESDLARHRRRIRFTLERVGALANAPWPQFVFAHLICPHPPFLFEADGSDVRDPTTQWGIPDGAGMNGLSEAEYIALYREQAEYIAWRTLETIDEILEKSPTPPVIILQADHGPDSRDIFWQADPSDDVLRERFGILNAYYLPDGVAATLYDDITPVNSFRVIFNAVFGTQFEHLPDECFHPGKGRSFWKPVTSRVRPRPTKDSERNNRPEPSRTKREI